MSEHVAGRATTFDKVEVLEEHFHSTSKVYPTLAAGVSVSSGGVWTLGLTGLLLGRLNMISLGFGAILFGLGMDFSIHLLPDKMIEPRLNLRDAEIRTLGYYEGLLGGERTAPVAAPAPVEQAPPAPSGCSSTSRTGSHYGSRKSYLAVDRTGGT